MFPRVDSLRIASLNPRRCNLQAFYNREACGAEREAPHEKGEIEGGCESQNRLFQMIRDPRTLEVTSSWKGNMECSPSRPKHLLTSVRLLRISKG